MSKLEINKKNDWAELMKILKIKSPLAVDDSQKAEKLIGEMSKMDLDQRNQ